MNERLVRITPLLDLLKILGRELLGLRILSFATLLVPKGFDLSFERRGFCYHSRRAYRKRVPGSKAQVPHFPHSRSSLLLPVNNKLLVELQIAPSRQPLVLCNPL